MVREPGRRLFLALWPDEPMRQAMAHATRKALRVSGGRPVPAGNLHITLAFLGSVPERQLAQLGVIARRAAALRGTAASLRADEPPIELAFGHVEYWRAAHLLCAVPSEPLARVAGLARGLRILLTEGGFAPALSRIGVGTTGEFRPHVTLARRIYRPLRAMDMDRVTWSFKDFGLLESKTLPEGPVYAVLEKFSLRC